MELPRCPVTEHGAMALQVPGTREQEYCGVWYRCIHCMNSELLISPALADDLGVTL